MSLLIVSGFAYVQLDVWRQTAWSSFEVSCCEHDETSAFHLINGVVSIPSSFHDLIGQEVFVEAMYSLLRSVVPTDIHHWLSVGVTVGPVNLRWDWLGKIIWVADVDPVTDPVQLTIVQDTIRYRYLALVVRKVGVGLCLLNVVETTRLDL
jgi:hypothetical protein